MKLTPLFLFSFLLISCGDPSNSKTAPTIDLDPNKIYIDIVEKTSLFSDTGAPVANIPVQLDYNGPIALSDTQGRVIFDITDSERHDIHVIPATTYNQWHSIYNVKKGRLNTIKLYASNKPEPLAIRSLVSFSGNITNYDQNNKYAVRLYETNGAVRVNRLSKSNTNVDYTVNFGFDYPVGRKVTGRILLQEYRYDANSREEILIDSVIGPTITAVTGKSGTPAQQLNIDGLVRAKPAQSDIVTVNALNIHPGFTLSLLDLSTRNRNDLDVITKANWNSVYSYFTAPVDLVFPKVFQSYTAYDYPQVQIFVTTVQILPSYAVDWSYSHIVARKTTITINPLINVFPDFSDNQQGEIINWNKVDSNVTDLSLLMSATSANGAEFSWSISLDPKATSVRLPNIAAAQQRLVAGQVYTVRLRGTVKKGKSFESFSLLSKTWTW